MKYSGYLELETMRLATRYNAFLSGMIIKAAAVDGPVLDFGAGMGTFADELKARAIDVHCLEPDETLAQKLTASGHHVIRDIEHVDESTYGLIYSLNVLEHIEEDEATLQALHDCLKPDGTLLLYVPAFQILYSAMDANVGHYRRYGMRQVRTLLERSGFDRIHIRYADSLGFFAALIYKWFSRSGGELSTRALVAYDRMIFPLSRLIDRLGAQFLIGKNVIAHARRR